MNNKKKKDLKKNRVDLSKRFTAYLIDWFLGTLLISIPMVFYYLFQTKDVQKVSDVNIDLIFLTFGKNITLIVGTLSLLIGFYYYVLIPYKNNGQTLAKKLFKFKIVKSNGKPIDFKTLIIRQVVVLFILEMYLYSVGSILLYLLKIEGFSLGITFNYLTLILTISSCLMVAFGSSQKALHDYIAKTEVVNTN